MLCYFICGIFIVNALLTNAPFTYLSSSTHWRLIRLDSIFHQLSLSFASSPASFHVFHPSCVSSSSALLLHVVIWAFSLTLSLWCPCECYSTVVILWFPKCVLSHLHLLHLMISPTGDVCTCSIVHGLISLLARWWVVISWGIAVKDSYLSSFTILVWPPEWAKQGFLTCF
jgi:hypothetical protein